MRKLAAATVLTAALLLPATPAGASTNSKQTVTTVTIKVKVKDLSGAGPSQTGDAAAGGCANLSMTETAYNILGWKMFSSELIIDHWCWNGTLITADPTMSNKWTASYGEKYCGYFGASEGPFLTTGWEDTTVQGFSFLGSCSAGMAYQATDTFILSGNGQYADGGGIPTD